MEFLLCADLIDAQRAYDMGLLNAIVPRDELLDAAYAFAAPHHRERAARGAGDEAERAAGPLPRRGHDEAAAHRGARAARRAPRRSSPATRTRRPRPIASAADVLETLGKELRTAFEKESRLSSAIFQTEDAREGPKAFAEKRQAELAGTVNGAPIDPRSPASSVSPPARGIPTRSATTARPSRSTCGSRSRPPRPRDSGGRDVLDAVDSLNIVYCQTCQYDDAPARLARTARHRRRSTGSTRASAARRRSSSSRRPARRSSTASATSCSSPARRRSRPSAARSRRGERIPYSFRPPERRPFPWEAPLHPAEVAHDVFQAWLTFAVFDNARRAHLGVGLDDYRHGIGEMMAPLTEIAAANPDAWFPIARTVDEIVDARRRQPHGRLSVHEVHGRDHGRRHGGGGHRREPRARPTRSACRRTSASTCGAGATRPTPSTSPSTARCGVRPRWRRPRPRRCGAPATAIDDVAHLDLYSCFASSLDFARDALGIAPTTRVPLSVTGGLPYHGGPGSGYMTHSIAQMARELRADPGSTGMVSGVGMNMTKHVVRRVLDRRRARSTPPDAERVQQRARRGRHRRDRRDLRRRRARSRRTRSCTAATASPSGRSSSAMSPTARAPTRVRPSRSCSPRAESEELVGRRVRLESVAADLPTGPGHRNLADSRALDRNAPPTDRLR